MEIRAHVAGLWRRLIGTSLAAVLVVLFTPLVALAQSRGASIASRVVGSLRCRIVRIFLPFLVEENGTLVRDGNSVALIGRASLLRNAASPAPVANRSPHDSQCLLSEHARILNVP